MTKARLAPPSLRPVPVIAVMRRSDFWRREPEAAKTVRRAISLAAERADAAGVEVAVVLSNDESVQELNRLWRGHDAPTNVLSFPAAKIPTVPQTCVRGDIAIAYETVAREAATEKKRFLDHLAHLAVHGFLHLLGYDHASEHDAEAMEGLERAILSELGIADPYAAPTRPTRRPRGRVLSIVDG